METYRYYPPSVLPQMVPYQVLKPGAGECKHALLNERWCDRVSVRDGIVFISFSCLRCGRQVSQSFDEVAPPATWNGPRA